MFSTEMNKAIVLQPPARLDATSGQVFQKSIAEIPSGAYDLWLVDMADVSFVDSRGLLCLMAGLRLAEELGCRFILCNVKATVRLIFEITQLDRVFEIEEFQPIAI